MREVGFGQYYPSHSFVHKMDARVKILAVIAYIVAVFLVKQFYFLGFLACFAFVVIATACSKIPFLKVLKSMKAIIFFIVLSAVLQLFFNTQGTPLWENGFITDVGLYSAGFIVLRITLIVLGASLLTLTTSPVE
ncbi:MAG: energy-coupling factor transporter transmembrane protein EcfT, partial [Clostridia bacterium]|nr:energy-coupling factor transporter transmembrane protein EcfT [Clostridia bacterium]